MKHHFRNFYRLYNGRIDDALNKVSKTLYEIYYTNGRLGPEDYVKIERAFHIVQGIDLTELKEMFDTDD